MAEGPTVAVLGTGIMGFPMAANVLAAGLRVRVWNRSRSRAEPLAEQGAVVTDTPAEAVRDADLVVTMLADGPAVEEVVGDDLLGGRSSAVWIQMSTVGPEWTRRLNTVAEHAGIGFVDAPVLGTKAPAEQGSLVVLASGPEQLRQRCEPMFDAVGTRTMSLGAVGAGSKLKLVTNAWVLALTNATAESIALAEQLDLDPALFLDAIGGGALDVPYAHVKGGAMMERTFPASFEARHAAKDAELVLAAAGEKVDLGATRAAGEHLRTAIDEGHGDDDMAVLYYGCAR